MEINQLMTIEPEELCPDCECPEATCECDVIEENCPDCGCYGMVCTCYDDFDDDWDEDLDEDEDDMHDDDTYWDDVADYEGYEDE